MESPATTAAAAAGPCVYVPISHPDSPVPTYAVLQVLGISPAPDPSAHPQFTPPMRPCSSPASTPPSPAPKRCASSAESTNSSSSDERDKHLTSLKPTPMKKSASGSGITSPGISPAARRNGKILPLKPIISITHTDKDTIIITDPADFRKVVHQLTGATSGDKGLMPITTTARSVTANRSGVGNDRDSTLPASNAQGTTLPSVGRENAGGSDHMDGASARKPVGNSTAMNLLERRKSNKVLGRLLTSCRKSTVLMPSPVTPLASDFEKTSLPLTPSSSEGSLTPGRLASAACLSPLSHGTKALETLSLSGGTPSHANGTVKDLIEVKPCRTEAMDIQPPEMSQLSLQTPNIRTRDDVHVASSNHTRSIERPNGDAARDGYGLSLALAPATGDLSLSNSSDVQNGVVPTADEDAMDTEIVGEGVVAQNTSSTVSLSSLVDDEGSIIAKKGFFFHTQRPCHGDPMLLTLFPESSREL